MISFHKLEVYFCLASIQKGLLSFHANMTRKEKKKKNQMWITMEYLGPQMSSFQ